MDSEQVMIKIVLESSNNELLKRSVQRITKIILSRDGRSLKVDPVEGSNGKKGVYRKTIGVFSPDQDLIDVLMMVELPPGVDCEIEL